MIRLIFCTALGFTMIFPSPSSPMIGMASGGSHRPNCTILSADGSHHPLCVCGWVRGHVHVLVANFKFLWLFYFTSGPC